jgi:predicted permease
VVALVAVLATSALLLLVVSGLNVGGMLLARGVARARATAVEVALGARGGVLVRGHLVEALILFLGGAVLGVGGSFAATEWLRRFEPPFSLPLVFDITPRAGALAAAVGVTLLVALAVALLPARQALRRRGAVATILQSGGRAGEARALSRTLRVVVAAQVALAIVLLVAAALFIRSLAGARSIDPGFALDDRWVFRAAPAASDLDPERRRIWLETLLERLAATAGIEAVGATTRLPLGLGSSTATAALVGPDGSERTLEVDSSAIDAGYLAALDLPLVAGRPLRGDDRAFAVVNQTLALKLAGSAEEAVGRRLSIDGSERTVVGVVRDSKVRRLWEAPRDLVHLPLGAPAGAAPAGHGVVVVSRLERAVLTDLLRRVLREYDPTVPAPAVRSLADNAAISLLPQRLAGGVATVLGAVCVAVAAIGLYGLFAFWVAARTQELGVRRAVGASSAALARMVLVQCARQIAVGAAVGVALAVGAAFLLRGLLVGVHPADPAALALGLGVLAIAAAVAVAPPLRRALAVDPSAALREEG